MVETTILAGQARAVTRAELPTAVAQAEVEQEEAEIWPMKRGRTAASGWPLSGPGVLRWTEVAVQGRRDSTRRSTDDGSGLRTDGRWRDRQRRSLAEVEG